MGKPGWYFPPQWLGIATLLLMSGCCLPPAQGPETKGGGFPMEGGGDSLRVPAQIRPPILTPAPQVNEQVSFAVQKLDSLTDEIKVLKGRLRHAESQLEDKDRLLSQAHEDLDKTRDAMDRTRKVLKDLETQMKKLIEERDNLKTKYEKLLKTKIKTEEMHPGQRDEGEEGAEAVESGPSLMQAP